MALGVILPQPQMCCLVGLSSGDRLALIMPAVSQHCEDDSLFSHDCLKHRAPADTTSQEPAMRKPRPLMQRCSCMHLLRNVTAVVTFHPSKATAIIFYLQHHCPAENLHFCIIEGECIMYHNKKTASDFVFLNSSIITEHINLL